MTANQIIAAAQTSTYIALAAAYREAVVVDTRNPTPETDRAVVDAMAALDDFAPIHTLTVEEQGRIGLKAWTFDEETFVWSEG